MAPFKSSLSRSAGKLFGVSRGRDTSLRGYTQTSRFVLNAPDMVLDTGDVGIMLLRVSDRKNDTSNNFSIEVGEGATPNQKFFFKVENLKLLSGDYEVEVSTKGISKFKNVSKNIEYFIALETA